MKKILMLFMLGMIAVAAMAQSTPKFSYQVVVRDTNNHLVTNGSNISFKWEVMNASNNVIYTENYTGLTTNANGLLTLQLGDSTHGIGEFWAVEWYDARVRTTITFNGQSIVSPIAPVKAVPYAVAAEILNPNGKTMKEILYMIDTVKTHIRNELADTAYSIRYQIDTVKTQIRAELADTATSIRYQIDTVKTQIRAELADTAYSIRYQIDTVKTQIRA